MTLVVNPISKAGAAYARRASLRGGAAALCALALAGCAGFSTDGGRDDVTSLSRARMGETAAAVNAGDQASRDATVRALLQQPLGVDDAVRIALLNNPGLQASLGELGIAEADLVQAGRLRNPGFSFTRLQGDQGREIDRSISLDFAGLLTMPLRREIEQGRFEQAKLNAALQVIKLAAATRRAWINATAAAQTAQYMEQVSDAAAAGAELAARMQKAGNMNQLDSAREQAFYSDASLQILRARQRAAAAREQLARLLGLGGLSGKSAQFSLPERLPDVPALSVGQDVSVLEAQALQERLDIAAARAATEASARALGLTRVTGVVNVLDLGYTNRSETGKARDNGYVISLELPLFDWGQARTAKAEAIYRQSVLGVAETAVRAASEVRELHATRASSHAIATRFRDELLPQRKKISDEVLLRYNGMLTGVFELLADAREQVATVNAAIEAQRDFWLADADFQMALHSGSPQ